MSTLATLPHKVLGPGDGLRIGSGPGRDLIFKVTGEDTGGAIDYLTVEVEPHGGPPLHVHHTKDELIQAVKGRYKVQIGEESYVIEEGGFAYLPRGVQHAFLNLTDEPAELTMVFTPGGSHEFFKELGPVARAATPDRAAIAAVFEKHDITLLGPPLTAD
ncbi:MAG TPA: cupin domain-containing protein [Gaiellaceae bacterium]|nr:cupin domain-containing protein [Gaiellaceae bacterium]